MKRFAAAPSLSSAFRFFLSRKPATTTFKLTSLKRQQSALSSSTPLNSTKKQRQNSPSKEMSITLTPIEAQICDLLTTVVERIHEQQPKEPRLVLRIAGGWVRDKLLGLESHDVDIAIDHMNGYELAQHVNQYLQDTGHPTRTVAKITQNPERSKHLETATTSVLGLLVDFVNLRSETYNGDSRIPNVAFGTPLEDALRRDITINALFYNIHTREVEDFTGKGLEDLKAGVIRTPLDPFKTFTDDPLRVLRVLRFASRFSYEIDKETSEAMGRMEIKEDLDRKISRERVGVELEKMAGGPHPLLSIQLILRFGLYLDIFRPPPTTTWLDPATTIDEPLAAHLTGHVFDLLERNTEILDCLSGYPRIDADPQAQRSLMLAAYLYPFRHVQVTDRKRNVPVTQVIIRDGLKLANSDIDTTLALHQLADQITQMAGSCMKGELSRCQLGLQIRVAGTRWPMAVIFAAAVEMLKSGNGVDARLVDMFGGFVRRVKEENLGEAYLFKHLVDGKAVAKLLGIKPGPGIKDVLDRVMEWQLANPEGTKEQCEVFIREEIAPGILPQKKK